MFDMDFTSMVEVVTNTNTKGNVFLSVGIIKDGKQQYCIYSKGREIHPKYEYRYEIGSVTKVFTISLLCKALSEGRICLDDSISKYITLFPKKYYPTIERLATHTSGYGTLYHKSMIKETLLRGNSFTGFNSCDLRCLLEKKNLKDKSYKWEYSNFGISVLGEALGECYNSSYHSAMMHCIKEDFKLQNTYFGSENGDLKNYWKWRKDDVYLATGALTSTISDMLKFVDIHLKMKLDYLQLAQSRYNNINKRPKYGLRFDSMGLGWIIDNKDDIFWHNGATRAFNSYIGFSKKTNTGVVLLVNLPPNRNMPVTILGPKLLQELNSGKRIDGFYF